MFNNLGTQSVFDGLLPIAVKVAAQTIGFDLVAVKPMPGPSMHIGYMDFKYGDQSYRLPKIKSILSKIDLMDKISNIISQEI